MRRLYRLKGRARGQPTADRRRRPRHALRVRARAARPRRHDRPARSCRGRTRSIFAEPGAPLPLADRDAAGHDRRARARAERPGGRAARARRRAGRDERQPARRRRAAPARRGAARAARAAAAAVSTAASCPGRRRPSLDFTGAEPVVVREGAASRPRRSPGAASPAAIRARPVRADRAVRVVRRRRREDPAMAVDAAHARAASHGRPRRARPRGRRPAGPRARAPARADRADRLRELHLAVGARGGRQRADEQVRRGLPGPALLRRLRGRRRDRAARDRPRQGSSSAPSTRTSSRTPARRPTWPSTWRCCSPATRSCRCGSTTAATSRTGSRSTSPGRLYTIVHYGVSRETNVVDYDEVRALAQGAPAEADRLRRLGVPAHGRDRPLPGDRRRGGRAAHVRHGALLGARRRGAAPEPGRALPTSSPRRRTRRSPGRAPGSSSAARSTRRRSTARSSRACRAGRSCTRSPPRRPASGSPRRRRSATTSGRCARTRTRSPTS